jgi:hypothetical protein
MMYSVIYNVLLNPFPYTDPRRMVDVIIQDAGNADRGIRGALAIPEFRAFVDESEIFEEATGAWLTSMIYRTGQGPEQFQVAALTPNSFHFLGVSALIGRTIGSDDVKAGAPPGLALDLGFNPRNVIVARMSLPDVFKAQRRQIFEAALPRIAALPGVVSAGMTSSLPAPFGGFGTDIDTPGSSHRERWTGQVQLCNDTYFQTVGLRLSSGIRLVAR